jgi:hypothetical protein
MSRPGLSVKRLNGSLGRRATTNDMTTAVVMNAIAIEDVVLGSIYTFITIEEVEALGITPAYDEANNVLVWHRLNRLFKRNPSITIHFMPVAQTVTLEQMADKDNAYLAKILRDKKDTVLAMIALNPETDHVPTIVTGLDEDSINGMYKLQELYAFEETRYRYPDLFIEGRAFSGTASAVLDLRKLENECPDVSMIIMADNDISVSNAIYNKYAAVEDFVGMISKAAISQNAGEINPVFNLTDRNEGFFQNAGLSSGTHINSFSETALDLLDEKGYIFATFDSEAEVPGYYIVDTHTCSKIDSDYAYVENNRTIKKAIRLARKKLAPRVKARLYVDETTGQLKPEIVKDLEVLGREALRPMLASGDISGGIDSYVDPAQNLLATSEFDYLLTFIPVAIGRKINLKIGFKNPLKSN